VKVKTLHVSTTNQYLNNFVSPKAPFYTNHNSSKFTHQNLNKSTFKFYEPNKRPPYRITALIPFPSKWDQSWITTNLISSLMPETSKKFTCVSIFFPIDMDDQAIIEISLKTQHMVDWFLTQNPPKCPRADAPKKYQISATKLDDASFARIQALKNIKATRNQLEPQKKTTKQISRLVIHV
jgi:hypothetical protein